MIRSLRAWTVDRDQRRRAASYVAALFAEPADDDVAWLSEHGTDCDTDHARWELRYARRALGLLAAQRDALDDRTASLVASELARALANDPAVAPGKIRMAERQLNARLSAYRDALGNRQGEGSGWHLGRTLLEFAGHPMRRGRTSLRMRAICSRAIWANRTRRSGRASERRRFLDERTGDRLRASPVALLHAEGGTRTPTGIRPLALNPARLPIPPLRLSKKRYGRDQAKSTRSVAWRIREF